MRYDINYADSNEVEEDNVENTCINLDDDEEHSEGGEDVAYRLQSMTKKKQDHVEGSRIIQKPMNDAQYVTETGLITDLSIAK